MASMAIAIVGVNKLIQRLQRAPQVTAHSLRRALVRAGLLIQRWSQDIVPIETSVLKNSAFTREEGSGMNPVVVIGYTAEYAIYVHEDLQAHHAPGKSAKFLEGPIRKNKQRLMDNIAKDAKVTAAKWPGM